jgi:hypothetical protein
VRIGRSAVYGEAPLAANESFRIASKRGSTTQQLSGRRFNDCATVLGV